ncbi:MAG: helix-turn-helix domain-containing protein [Bdellovibrionales bacterium]
MADKKERFEVLGDFLKFHRKSKGFTQWDVAKELGYTSSQFISNFERGLCAPSFETLPKLIEMYSIPEKEILDLLLQQQEKFLREKLFGDAQDREGVGQSVIA